MLGRDVSGESNTGTQCHPLSLCNLIVLTHVGSEVCVKSDSARWTVRMKVESGNRYTRVLPDNVCESWINWQPGGYGWILPWKYGWIMNRRMDGQNCRQKVRQLKISFHSWNLYQSEISMRAGPIGAAAICEVLRAIQCICQPASHGPALLSSAYSQSIPPLQHHSMFLFLSAPLMHALKDSICYA